MNTDSILAFLSNVNWTSVFEYWIAFLAAMGIVAFVAHSALGSLLDLQRKKLRHDFSVVLARYTIFREQRETSKLEINKYESLSSKYGYESERLTKQSDIEFENSELYKQLWNFVYFNPNPEDLEHDYREAAKEHSDEARRYQDEAVEAGKSEL